MLIEYFSDRVWPRAVRMGYRAVRTERWKCIRYTELEGMDEMYDLHADPFELRNLWSDARFRAERAELRRELRRLLRSTAAPVGGEARSRKNVADDVARHVG